MSKKKSGPGNPAKPARKKAIHGPDDDATDEMKLKLLANSSESYNEDALYPAELNQHLLSQIKILTDENADLRILNSTKDTEIKELVKTVSSLNQRIRDIICNTGPTISSKSAGIISAKISDLCKQNRHLVAEVESYKTKNSVLERKLLRTESELQEKEHLEECKCHTEPPDQEQLNEIEDLKQKNAQLLKKHNEAREKNISMKNELQLANKYFQQEIGNEFTSIKDLSNTKGWKGRAQQIILLQAKISNLEETLNIKNKNLVEERRKENQAQHFRELENKRKRELEDALKESNHIKEENVDLKRKLDGARARMRILECDCTTLRQKLMAFSDKSSHDDELVDEQRKQFKLIEIHYQEVLKEKQAEVKKLECDRDDAKKELSNVLFKIDAFQKQVFEKASRIDELKKQIARYEEGSLQNVFLNPMKTARDMEIKKLSEMIVTLNERLVGERSRCDELLITIKKLKIQKKNLHKLLQKLETANEELKKKRRASFKDLGSTSRSLSGSRSTSSLPAKDSKKVLSEISEEQSEGQESEINIEREEVEHKLEIADEKLKLMEDRIRSLEEEKDADYRHLTGMLQTSKQQFTEALDVLMKQRCVCVDNNCCSCDL